MRKLMSKKGFTLVELMIVVVILGILVAVAVPIFGAVTKNAQTKACKSNQRVIKGNMETYYMTGGDNGEQLTVSADIDLASTTPAEFTKLFDGGVIPTCKANNAAYGITIKAASGTDGVIAYQVWCKDTTFGNAEYTATPADTAIHNK